MYVFAPPCPGDLDGDAQVAIVDLLQLLSAWGPCESLGETAKLTASDAAAGDSFGGAVSLDGDTALVGAPHHGVALAGSAYILVRSAGAWMQQQQLTDSDAAAGDRFSLSVALDGDTAVVGAPQDQAFPDAAGYADVFVRNQGIWSLQQRLTASDGAPGDRFGWAVAIAGDTVVVGAYGDDSSYVFVRNGSAWTQEQKLTAADAAGLGASVSIDADTVVLGAPYTDTPGAGEGSAYVFVRTGSNWTQQQKLVHLTPGPPDHFGSSVSVDGDTVAVGAPWYGGYAGSAYIFVRNGTIWFTQQQLIPSDAPAFDFFGSSVSIDGTTVVIGAPGNDGPAGDDQGAAYVFVRNVDTWTEAQKLIASDACGDEGLGLAVAIDGNTVAIGDSNDSGAPGLLHGSAYVFTPLCPGDGDFDLDGLVGIVDFLQLLASWGTCP